MADRVVEQVAERLLEPERVGVEDQAVGAASTAASRRVAVADPLEQLAGAQLLRADRQLALVAAGDHEQVLGERDEPVGLLRRRAQRVGQLLVRARRG